MVDFNFLQKARPRP